MISPFPLTTVCMRSLSIASLVFSSQVHYTFNKILMLQEPLLVVGAFYILFFTVIIYVRLDFAITKVTVCASCV